jgi:hypothetical protein
MGFTKGFLKVAAPGWFYELNKVMANKSIKAHSKKGLAGLLKRRGIK